MRTAIAALVLGAALTGQTLKEKLEQKLAGAWVQNADWVTDYDAAKKQALEEGKLIFAYFTRSYAP